MRQTLTDLANSYGSDKGTTFKEAHGYTHVYEELLGGVRLEPLKLLEIGLRHDRYYPDKPDHTWSPSIQMWLDFFPHAMIYGVDVNDYSSLSSKRVSIFQGDQGDPAFLTALAAELPSLDAVIDDGSHASFHQQMSFGHLINCVDRERGYYFIEDLHFQPANLEAELPKVPKTKELLKSPVIQSRFDVSFRTEGKLAVIRWAR